MALFGRKKEEVKDEKVVVAETKAAPKPEKSEKKAEPAAPNLGDRNLSAIILRPRITEKAALQHDSNVYTFEIRQDATKHDVRDAVKELWNVTPTKINIVKQTPREHFSRFRGRRSKVSGLKKAYIYLKKGDRIELA